MNHEENHVVAALVDLCKRMEVKCVVQVGAEDGYEAGRIREATGCRAVAIEGDSRCAPFSPDIEYHYSLIGATDCVMPFYVTRASGLPSQIRRGLDGEETHELKQRRLDTFCSYHGIGPDALIVDTEGTSLDVLDGAGRLLHNMKLVYAECQTVEFRPGMRLIGEVDKLLVAHGMTQHLGLPTYDGGSQGNYTWVRK